MTKVITYGTYDLLHYGHIKLLERAKELGDYLIVGVTADDFDRTRGKINVQQSLMERVEAVRRTGLADEIIVEEYEGQKIDDIKKYGVDIFTVGSDWTGVFDYLKEYCEVVYLDRTQGVSSSEIRASKNEIRLGIIGDSQVIAKFISESEHVNGINIIGIAGAMKAKALSEDEKKSSVKDFNFSKGIMIALLCGFMSGCFNIGLAFGTDINFGDLTPVAYKTLPATFLVTLGGFFTNAIYCFYQNHRNHTWSDYTNGKVFLNNFLLCILAGALWYSQFFGLSIGKGYLVASPALMTLSFCILMALNVVFSNIWGIILKEWKGCQPRTIAVLIVGIVVLIISCFLPQII